MIPGGDQLRVSTLDGAFSPDVQVALTGSIELALELGVDAAEVLDTDEKTLAFFLDKPDRRVAHPRRGIFVHAAAPRAEIGSLGRERARNCYATRRVCNVAADSGSRCTGVSGSILSGFACWARTFTLFLKGPTTHWQRRDR
ncbi:hypothetical protein GCM10011591_41670 [Nocardia camponoti]|uniref:Uncharacterized protein n=1 Tax=Nocardia camponoti TaxID=1616106 RepID=A0A917QRM6_9NOCA|nr:hypothetical protein GCM10011591_41670 [Nocardia camponoti]